MTRRAAAAAAAALFLLAGCSLVAKTPRARQPDEEWARERDLHTRQYALYDGFVHRASATAMYLAPSVREARARQLGKWLAWTPEELDKQLALERADGEKYDEFVVSFFSADFSSNDLDAPKSVWRMAVELPGAAVLPLQVRSVDRDATILALYPWVGRFDTVYVLRFPRTKDPGLETRPFKLMLASGLGQMPFDFGAPPGRLHRPDQAP